MNDFTVFIYFVMFAILVGTTISYMNNIMRSTLDSFNKTQRRPVHPEMRDVKSGEELLVFKPSEEEDDDDEGNVLITRK